MPMMKSPYDQQIISLTGHSVEFKAGEPVWVPESKGLAAECLGRGATMCDETEETPPAPAAAPVEKSDNERDMKAEFAVALDQALTRILVRNDPTDLKADMMPKVNKVTAEMSPELRRPTATEISDAYARLQENIDLAE